ncbi:uncharacterized protein LOC119728075 [Patiria miniata]|uniref:Uncharacterized protein n=1 Tax=Patiria miniata TaxID=46514 RepID=A0A913ZX04_PATMI|nr:uncharacterized protein LOC119728075 [Patiria miniata]
MTGNEERMLPWKDRPLCHFTWNLKVAVTTDYERIIRNIDHDLEETPNVLRIESLLFRAYLEVWDNRKRWDVRKAREFLDRADECIERTDVQLRKGYRVVALLNRMWIEYKCHNTQKVTDLLNELNSVRLRDKDHSVVGAVRAAALTRLGPHVKETALQLFEVALQSFPKNVDFIYGAGLMTGRMARYRRSGSSLYKKLDKEGQRLMDNEKEYWLKMMRKNDEYQLARSSLGLNLSRRGKKDRKKGCQHLTKAYEKNPEVQEVVRNLARFYKGTREFEEAIPLLKNGIERSPDCPESHFQLALCYIACSKRDKAIQEKKDEWNKEALEELHKCLDLNKGHNFALTKLCNVHAALGNHEEAEKIYETGLQQSEHRTSEDKLDLYFRYAKFLHYTPAASRHDSRMDMWHTVMDIAASFEYLDEASGTWQVSEKAKWPKELAHEKLLEYYVSQNNSCLEVGILHFQNFNFKEAERLLVQHDTEANFKITWYLAQTYLKMGLEEELQALSQNIGPDEAKETFRKAHENALRAMEVGLNQGESRKLLADIALAIAHNEFQLLNLQQPTLASIPLESRCIMFYRKAVRCGSLVASLELLRLIQKDSLQITSRWIFLQILAEIDVSCSLRSSNFLHQEENPLSFGEGLSSRDRDKDASALNCKTIKRDVMAILHQEPFFRQAWREHFNMEREILLHRFENNEGELELDGREEEKKDTFSDEIVHAATDCCEKLRPLLDRIVVRFGKEELGLGEMRGQYFPLILDERNAANIQDKFRRNVIATFGIDMKKHYPKLYEQLLMTQPGCSSQNGFLKTFCTLVNKIKHSDVHLNDILQTSKDPVALARQCTDKVEEICNFFFVAMKKSRDLQTKVKQLEDDIRRGEHETADELLQVLSNNEDFVVRIGSTWTLLEMMALIRTSRRLSSPRDVETDELESKLTDGGCTFTQKLRRCHQTVEDALLHRNNEVRTKCRDTCREAVKLLNSVLAKHKNEVGNCGAAANLKPNSPKVSRRAQKVTEERPIAFPFLDMCPDDESRQQNEPGHWKGVVKKQLEKNLSKMGVDKKLVDIILKAQPCVSEENYNFIAMETFLQGGGDDVIVRITTCNGEEKSFQVLDLTRWCTDNAERLALEMATIIPSLVHG